MHAIGNELPSGRRMSAYHSFWLGGVPQHPLCGWSLQSPWSTLCPFLQISLGMLAHQRFLLWSSVLAKTRTWNPTTFDIVAWKFSDLLHHFKHLLEDLLQDFCLFADDIVCDLLTQRQNALQLIQEGQWHLVVFVLFFQELTSHALALLLICEQLARTSKVTLATPKTAFATGFN